MSNNFDEAAAATEDLFEQEQLSLADSPTANDEVPQNDEEPTGNSPTAEEDNSVNENGEPTGNSPVTETRQVNAEEAAQTAELAARVASEKDGQLQQALQDIENLKQQNQRLQGTIDELSQKNAENIIEEALSPPVLDINGLAFADEETQKAAMAKYAEDMSAYNRKLFMNEISPALEYAKKGLREAEKSEVIDTLSHIPELSGIRDVLPQLDRIIANNKWLSSDDMPTDEKYINAFAMARGIDSINNPKNTQKEPTTEELMAIYNNNPNFREMVEKQRLEELKQSQQVPPFSASSGAVNAALNIKEKPKTLEEASERTRKMFGGM